MPDCPDLGSRAGIPQATVDPPRCTRGRCACPAGASCAFEATEDIFRQWPVEVRGYHELARAQAERPLRAVRCRHRLDLRDRALAPDNEKRFAALDPAEVAGRIAFDLLDADRRHDAIVASL